MQVRRIATLFSPVLIAAVVVLLLASQISCGQHAAPPSTPASTPQAPSAPAPTTAPPPPAAETTAGPAPVETGEDAADEETGVAATPDNDQANIRLAQALMPPPAVDNLRWKQGKDYGVVRPAQPVETTSPDKVEVLEMFWYGCPHCYGLEPYLQAWDPKKAPYIEFKRVPATWGPVHQMHARLFYTLQVLNRSDLHMTAFREIQVGGNPLIGRDIPETASLQADFAKRHGIDPEAYKKAFNSKEVLDKLEHADQLLRRYKVDSVPHIVINGKYFSDISAVGGQSQLISLINDLAAREHSKQ